MNVKHLALQEDWEGGLENQRSSFTRSAPPKVNTLESILKVIEGH